MSGSPEASQFRRQQYISKEGFENPQWLGLKSTSTLPRLTSIAVIKAKAEWWPRSCRLLSNSNPRFDSQRGTHITLETKIYEIFWKFWMKKIFQPQTVYCFNLWKILFCDWSILLGSGGGVRTEWIRDGSNILCASLHHNVAFQALSNTSALSSVSFFCKYNHRKISETNRGK